MKSKITTILMLGLVLMAVFAFTVSAGGDQVRNEHENEYSQGQEVSGQAFGYGQSDDAPVQARDKPRCRGIC